MRRWCEDIGASGLDRERNHLGSGGEIRASGPRKIFLGGQERHVHLRIARKSQKKFALALKKKEKKI